MRAVGPPESGGAPLLATANVTVGAVVSREAREFLRDGVL